MDDSEARKPQVALLIVDLDNTLWDWVDVWVNSFAALLDALVHDTGLDEELLKKEMRAVHRRRGTTEYSWLLDELPSLSPFLNGQLPHERFDSALHAQNSVRKHETQLYPTVLSTLRYLRTRGVKIVGYTESLWFWSEWRIRETGLDGVLDAVYSSPDHDMPAGVSPKQRRTLSEDKYHLKKTVHQEAPRGILKPNPHVLEAIINEYAADSSGIAYVGDNLSKDIAMAQAVGVFDVHAAYGEAHKRPEYQLLVDVTHWTDEMVERERETRPGVLPTPSFVLREAFAEILDMFEFGRPLDVQAHVRLWEKAVDVQQHFNDIGWRIRALALTALTFILGATGFAYLNMAPIRQLGGGTLAPLVPVLGILIWAGFWFMDSLWFHRLLKGAVEEGTRLEKLLTESNVRVDLGASISQASSQPLFFKGWRMHSTTKLNYFYGGTAIVLGVIAVVLMLVGPPHVTPNPHATSHVQTAASPYL